MAAEFIDDPKLKLYARHCVRLLESSTTEKDGYAALANFVIAGLSPVELDLPDLFLRFYCVLHADTKYAAPTRDHLSRVMALLQPAVIQEAHREEFHELCVHMANMLCQRLSTLAAEAMTTTAAILGVTVEVKMMHVTTDQDSDQPDAPSPFLH